MVSKEDIIKVAKLSRLLLSDEEIEKYQKEFINILNFFDSLSEVNTDGVSPISQITGLENIVSDDTVSSFKSEDLLECSNLEKVRNQIAVPAVM